MDQKELTLDQSNNDSIMRSQISDIQTHFSTFHSRNNSMHSLKLKSQSTYLNSPQIAPYKESKNKFYKLPSLSSKYENHPDEQQIDQQKEAEIIDQLNTSEQLIILDQVPQTLVGQNSQLEFFKHSQKLDFIVEQNSFTKTNGNEIQKTKTFNILSYTSQILRLSLHFFNDLISVTRNITLLNGNCLIQRTREESINSVCLLTPQRPFIYIQNSFRKRNHHFGDNYAQVIFEGLQMGPQFSQFNFKSNRLTEQGANSVLFGITQEATIVDISNNSIGKIGVDLICRNLEMKGTKLQYINLENNKLGDYIVITLLESVQLNGTLKKLNLSQNFLSNIAAPSIATILQSSNLVELYLHWNIIGCQGATEIFHNLIDNDTLQVLDFSFNQMGNYEGFQSLMTELSEFFNQNQTLVHLDLSSCNFNWEESLQISVSLKENHTIHLHFIGNHGFVDAKGFLILNQDDEVINSNIHIYQRIEGLKNQLVNPHQSLKEKAKDVCWICQGWREEQFIYSVDKCRSVLDAPYFLHIDFENFVGIYLGAQRSDKTYRIQRMLPPGKVTYFYGNEDFQTVTPEIDEIESYIDGMMKQEIQVYQGQTIVDAVIKEVNFKNVQKQQIDISYSDIDQDISSPPTPDSPMKHRSNILFDSKAFAPETVTERRKLVMQPLRVPDEQYVPPKEKLKKVKWSWPISIWAQKGWKRDTPEKLNKIFEIDWGLCQIPRVVKSETQQKEIKELIRPHYNQFRQAYKFYASFNPVGDVWAITSNAFTEFVSRAGIFDGVNLKLSDIDLRFIGTNSASSGEYKGNIRNPERGIVRFQFMEIIMRLADDRYQRNGLAENSVQSMKQILEECCLPHFQNFDAQKWRDERYYNQQCDIVCKTYQSILQRIFDMFSVKKKKPGEKNFMCLDEMKEICTRCNFFDETFVQRDMMVIFNNSMWTQEDELNSDRIFQMYFLEYLQAIARIAEEQSLYNQTDEVTLDIDQRKALPLHVQLQAMCQLMTQTFGTDDQQKGLYQRRASMIKSMQIDPNVIMVSQEDK